MVMEDLRNQNRYLGVIMAARRARQLNDGVNFTPEMEGRKITTIVLDEYHAGMLSEADGTAPKGEK